MTTIRRDLQIEADIETREVGELIWGGERSGQHLVTATTNPLTGRVKESVGSLDLPSRSYRTSLLMGPIVAHSAPPSISLSASGAATSITNGVRIQPKMIDGSISLFDPENDPHFSALGAAPGKLIVDASDIVRSVHLTGGSAQSARWRVMWEWQHTGRYIEIYARALSGTTKYRIWATDPATGRVLPTTTEFISSATSTGQRYRIVIDFGSVGTRVMRYEPEEMYFGGVWIEPSGSVTRTAQRRARLGVMSDSTGAGANSIGPNAGWPHVAAHYLDMDCFNLSIGGSGYIAAPSFISRLQDVIDANLDYLVIAGGQNDKAHHSTDAILAAASEFITAVQRNCPTTRVILGGIHMQSDNNDATGIPLEAGLKLLAAQKHIPFISQRDPMGLLETTQAWAPSTAYIDGSTVVYQGLVWVCRVLHTSGGSWDKTKWRATSFLSGTGKVGATVGDGNADAFMGSDGVHYSTAGHAAQGLWYAQQILRAIN